MSQSDLANLHVNEAQKTLLREDRLARPIHAGCIRFGGAANTVGRHPDGCRDRQTDGSPQLNGVGEALGESWGEALEGGRAGEKDVEMER